MTGPEMEPVASKAGLTDAEVATRRARDGLNVLPSPLHRSAMKVFISALFQPMVLLLLACALVYAATGDLIDGALLSSSIVVVIGIAIYQELRAQHVLEALSELASPRSVVVRNGKLERIPSPLIVRDDRLIVQQGDRIACDAHLIEANAIAVDESLLTGESMPVEKHAAPANDVRSLLKAGTLVVQGDGVAIVQAVGSATALGRIGASLNAIAPRESLLNQELKALVRRVAIVAIFISVVVSIAFAVHDGSWVRGLLVGLTLAMAIIPEEFAVVWSVMLALGAWRLAQVDVLTRQPQAIEALGATTVLCVDKTGTLTLNRMEIAALDNGNEEWRAADAPPGTRFQALIEAAALASSPEAMDPMDQAILREVALRDDDPLKLVHRSTVAAGHPFVAQHWQRADGSVAVGVKGAVEAVLARCVGDRQVLDRLERRAAAWGTQGLRVLAVAAHRGADAGALEEQGWTARGLIAFSDPLRPEVPQALDECRAAGIRVIMITGDSSTTALAIARMAGIAANADVAVFARVSPAQKLRIVEALQSRGESVAMTGDGVNDGPALRAADIGVAMGKRGTDVAREAASLVLLEDRFASLVEAIRAGRRIFRNLQSAIGYLIAVHVPIVGLALFPLFGGPTLLLPIHVILLELIIDPACSLVFEAEPSTQKAMQSPPRARTARLFDLRGFARAMFAGGLALILLIAVELAGRTQDFTDDELRLAGFATIVVGNLALLQAFRKRAGAGGANKVFNAILAGVALLASAILSVPSFAAALSFPSIAHGPAWGVALALATVVFYARAWLRTRFPIRAHRPAVE